MNFESKRWRYMMAAMLLALCSGIGYAWSVFQKPLMENFEWALETISITFTVQVMISTLAPVFLSRFQKIWGVQKYLRVGMSIYILGILATMFTSSIGYLYIVYGIVVGIGIAMLYPALMAYATGLFPDKTGMASGLLASAYGSGAVLWAPIATFFMNRFGVLSVFGLLAGIFAVIMVPVSFIIRGIPANFKSTLDSKRGSGANNVTAKDYTWKEMLQTVNFYMILVSLTLGATAGLMITGHASGMMQEILSFTAEQAAVLVGIFSAFNALGRLIFGFVSDRLGRYNVILLLFAVIGGAMLILSQTTGLIFVIALLSISACYGGFASMFSPVCADNFGMKHLSVNYSFLYIAYGMAGLIGPQMAARIRSASGSYETAFLAVAGMSVVGFILVLRLRFKKNSQTSNTLKESE
ncbi:L-lactate MFS transporter [Anoxynatronum buryatiense]|uniref:MFS transporter, OFA family, oxalate/formate antiporter n=1 Tax=Anoxynatronum buryatiense TaxID=489973 RepID=A0AA46AHS5_9CLOT|nr:OFA family MFS transporter [Anoxynatronum buryatiense]SMP42871.1 MFS transporter, OFA family, oxalate/formate antiporter [Anoxynatronum buryatiense]